MPELEPITGYLPAPTHAADVVAPPFDALSVAQRRHGSARPDSFLGVLPPTGEVGAAELARCRDRLDELLRGGRYERFDVPSVGVLELDDGRHRMVGVLGDVAASAFEDGSVAPHERVRGDRVEQVRRHVEAVGAVSSPVCVAHRPDERLAGLTAAARAEAPRVQVRDAHGTARLWVVDDPERRDALASAVGATTDWLVADGHHRAVAARPWGRVLCVLVGDDDLGVRPFRRRIPADEPERAGAVLDARGLEVIELPGAAPPMAAGEVTLAGGERWWRVRLPEPRGSSDPVADLDVVRAEREVLAPLLPPSLGTDGAAGGPPPDDARIEAIAPTVDLAQLPRPGTVAVVLRAPSLADVRRVVAAGRTMPPKTTYVVPKQRSGLVVITRGDVG